MCKLDLNVARLTPEVLEHELRDHFREIDAKIWLDLPIDLKYPAPDHIKAQKSQSGLSWVDFENQLKENIAS